MNASFSCHSYYYIRVYQGKPLSVLRSSQRAEFVFGPPKISFAVHIKFRLHFYLIIPQQVNWLNCCHPLWEVQYYLVFLFSYNFPKNNFTVQFHEKFMESFVTVGMENLWNFFLEESGNPVYTVLSSTSVCYKQDAIFCGLSYTKKYIE